MDDEIRIDYSEIEECTYLSIFMPPLKEFKEWTKKYGLDAKRRTDVKVKVGDNIKRFTIEDFLNRLEMEGE